MGEQFTIPIDDKLPVDGHGNPFLNKKSRNGAWWGSLVEKAGAKYWGNYANMHFGK